MLSVGGGRPCCAIRLFDVPVVSLFRDQELSLVYARAA